MYVPPSFRQHDHEVLQAFMRRHSFATLVSQLDGVPFATHLPLLHRAQEGSDGQLLGHVARANPQWQELAGQQVLAIFNGPHAYVSPTWYGVKDAVPTWNYQAVHVYGTCELVEEQDELLEILVQSVASYEQPQPRPWVLDRDDPFVHKLLKGIVGFRVNVDRIEGKWKLGQNHSAEMRQNVIARLADSEEPEAREIAALMAATLNSDA